MLFYLIYFGLALIIFLLFFIIREKKLLDHPRLENFFDKFLKVWAIFYFLVTVVSIILPDGFIRSQDFERELIPYRNYFQAILRIGNSISTVIVILSVFFKNNRLLKQLVVFIAFPSALLSAACYPEFMMYFLDSTGRGLANTSLGPLLRPILFNEFFRASLVFIQWIFVYIVGIYFMMKNGRELFLKDKKEVKEFVIVFICLVLSLTPIYVPQLLFGFTKLVFSGFSTVHLVWIGYIVAKIIVLSYLFKNKTYEEKYLLILILALSVFFQYNQMFSLTISLKRLPLQLCNLASYLMLYAVITKNRHIFNFNFIVNVMGASLALLVPDVNGTGVLNVWNLHFIYEHTNVICLPILALTLGIFPKIDKEAFKDYFKGFNTYFVIVFVLGIVLNGLANKLGNEAFLVNYFFMFDKKVVVNLLPIFETLTIYKLNLFNYVTIYPFLIMFIYFGYNFLCFGFCGLMNLNLVRKPKIVFAN